jgi:creatinine amidohydrolase
MLTIHDTRTEFDSRTCTTALLPVGAVEQHGKHLPFGTDIMLAEAVAKPIAEKLDAYLLPAVAISASIEHRKARGTVYLRAQTLGAVVGDIAASLRDSGFQRLVIVNFHGGNWILKPTVRELNRDLAPFRVVLLQPDLPASDAREIFEHRAGDIHAGEFETSLMLHLHPGQVRAIPTEGARAFPPQPFLDYFDSTQLTEEGYWGWPEAATAEKGRRAFESLVNAGLRFVEDIEAMDRQISTRSVSQP